MSAKNIRVPNANVRESAAWDRFWRRFGKAVRAQNGASLIGMKY